MKQLKPIEIIYIVVISLIALVIIIVNLPNEDFWTVNIIQILTFWLTAIISFFFVQRLTDKRRKIDCYEHILTEIQNNINDNGMLFSHTKEALTLQKSIANKIKHLQDHSFSQISKDLKYISDEFTELRELYDNHNQSPSSLSLINSDISRHKANISDKIDKIKLVLYDI